MGADCLKVKTAKREKQQWNVVRVGNFAANVNAGIKQNAKKTEHT